MSNNVEVTKIIRTSPRIIRDGSDTFCTICKSTMTRTGFLRLFGKLKCDNKQCETNKKYKNENRNPRSLFE